jgi:AcrR family transcriptional regulator
MLSPAPRRDAPTRRDTQREQTRRRVYEAALEVFRRDGVEEARIDDIVAIAGVSRGSFYFHFPTKDDVLAEAYADAAEGLLTSVTASPMHEAIREVLVGVVRHVAGQWEHDPRIFVPVGLYALRSVSRSFPLGERDPLRQHLTARFARALAAKELHSALPPELLADIFLLNTFTAMLAWSGNPQLPMAPALEAVVSLFLEGAAPVTR